MDKKQLTLVVTGLSVLISLFLTFAGIPHTVMCTVAKYVSASVYASTSN